MLASSTFSAGIRLLPAGLYGDAHELYCMLRTIDDLVDEQHPDAIEHVEALEHWARSGEVRSAEAQTLSNLSERYPLSARPIIDFCQGMRYDIARREIVSEGDLDLYCYWVGGTVGVMIAELFGSTDPSCAAKMALLGAAMQRTNILRDIDEDLQNGRLYIARSTIARFGFPFPGEREELIRDQIARADELYERGWGALRLLATGRRAMTLSTVLYREILRQIERDGFGRNAGRAVIPRWRKSLLLARHRFGSAR
ncbi:MAG TPA: squalene/phytoene synthase family protein [Solirubrobacteraceae bacterium]|nr:squalene/phytoene synthase family protein [Solirubrobacteraceae bacterium]